MRCNSSSSGVCREDCKHWHRIPSPTRLILPRPMRSPRTSTRRHRLRIRTSTAGDSDFDIRHSFTAGVTYNLPAPGSQEVVQRALGGWSLDSFVLARSAPPVDVVGSHFYCRGHRPLSPPERKSRRAACALWVAISRRQASIKQLLLRRPPGSRATWGATCCGVSEPGKPILALQRQFHVTEKVGLRFRAEFFNIFNHPNFGSPNNTLTSPLFGQSTQTLASSLGPAAPMAVSTLSTKLADRARCNWR